MRAHAMQAEARGTSRPLPPGGRTRRLEARKRGHSFSGKVGGPGQRVRLSSPRSVTDTRRRSSTPTLDGGRVRVPKQDRAASRLLIKDQFRRAPVHVEGRRPELLMQESFVELVPFALTFR